MHRLYLSLLSPLSQLPDQTGRLGTAVGGGHKLWIWCEIPSVIPRVKQEAVRLLSVTSNALLITPRFWRQNQPTEGRIQWTLNTERFLTSRTSSETYRSSICRYFLLSTSSISLFQLLLLLSSQRMRLTDRAKGHETSCMHLQIPKKLSETLSFTTKHTFLKAFLQKFSLF